MGRGLLEIDVSVRHELLQVFGGFVAKVMELGLDFSAGVKSVGAFISGKHLGSGANSVK